MSKFNGFSEIELEMMREEIAKALPGLLMTIPTFAQVVKANYEELKKQGFKDHEAMYLSVQSAGKQMGFN